MLSTAISSCFLQNSITCLYSNVSLAGGASQQCSISGAFARLEEPGCLAVGYTVSSIVLQNLMHALLHGVLLLPA